MRIFRFLAAAAVALVSLTAVPAESSARTTSKDLYKQFQNPDSRYRPFVRWWWNGDRVEAEELVRELHILKDAVLGHDELVDLVPLAEFFFQQFSVLVGVGNINTEVVQQFLIGDCPPTIFRMLQTFPDRVIRKLLEFAFVHNNCPFICYI